MRKIFYISASFFIFLSFVFSIPVHSHQPEEEPFLFSLEELIQKASGDSVDQQAAVADLKNKLIDLSVGQRLRTLKVLGDYYYRKEKPDSAIHFFDQGLELAEETGDDYYSALFHLWKGINYNIQSEYEAGLHELNAARQVADITDSVKLRSSIARNTGNIYWGMGIYEKALENYFSSLNISEEHHFTHDIASSLNNIGNVYQSVGDYQKARGYYSRAYDLADRHNFRLIAAITSNNIGDALLKLNQYDSALSYFRHSLRLSEAYGSKFHQGIALFNIGNIYLKHDSLVMAENYFRQSLSKAVEAGDRLGIAECYLKLGELYLSDSLPGEALPYIDSGSQIAERIGSLRLLDQSAGLKTGYFTQLSDFPAAYKTLETRLALKDSMFKQESGKSIAKLEARYREEKRMQQIASLQREKKNSRTLYLIGTFSLLIILILIYLGLRASKKTNAMLQAKNDEIEAQKILLIQKNSELQKSQEELKRINKGKDQFLTIISHDLRNPVSAIRGFTELLIKRFDELDVMSKKRFLQEIFDSIERTSLLINNILYWARSQTTGLKVQPVKFDLHKRIHDNFSLYRIIAESKKISLINKVPAGFDMTGDTNIYDIIFRNLISNSLKFTGHQGTITFDATRSNGKTVISIHDTGTGMEQSRIKDIMNHDVHFSETGTHHEKGTGLGLSLVLDFVKYLPAKVNIDSAPGQGTSISLILHPAP